MVITSALIIFFLNIFLMRKTNLLIFIFFTVLTWPSFSQSTAWTVKNDELQNNWQIQSSAKVADDGAKISTLQFNAANWYAANVPNSTLGTLVDDGVFKNIFFNRNLEKIPDSLFNVPWWYRRTFELDNVIPQQFFGLCLIELTNSTDAW